LANHKNLTKKYQEQIFDQKDKIDMIKRTIAIALLTLAINTTLNAWGKIGHRIVGEIAEAHLTKKAKKNLKLVLGSESLAESGIFMDFIRANSKYNHTAPWHYCTIPDGQTYEQAGTPEEGDAIVTIQRLMEELKTKKFSEENEAFALKCLIHLIGDIHQPLHVGKGDDKGGNDVQVKFFREMWNLHAVWDSGIIEEEQLSYTEYAQMLDFFSKEEIEKLQSAGVMQWVEESKSYRPQVYDIGDDKVVSWKYIYNHKHILDRRLKEAGIRLAGVLNEIYG
jgi:hypothetical protein